MAKKIPTYPTPARASSGVDDDYEAQLSALDRMADSLRARIAEKKSSPPRGISSRDEYEASPIQDQFYSINYSTIKKVIHGYKKMFNSKRAVYVDMELVNGKHLVLMVPVKAESFKFSGGVYVIDESLKYYNLTLREWMLSYHESISLPLSRRVPVEFLRKAVKHDGQPDEVIYAMNPHSLSEFMTNNTIKAAIQASSISPLLKKVLVFVLLTGVVSLITLGLFVYKSGLLKGVGVG